MLAVLITLLSFSSYYQVESLLGSPLEEAKRSAKTATRQYAKRQLTWFRHRMSDWMWLEQMEIEDVSRAILQNLGCHSREPPLSRGQARE